MKLYYIYIFLFAIMFIGCDETIDADQGPCKFPPSESNFPVFSPYCTECFFILQFQGEEYSFDWNQINSGGPSDGPGWRPDRNILVQKTWNSFLSFYIVSPSSVEILYNSIGVKTPLLKVDTLSKLTSVPPPVSASFGIYNYCNDFFEPTGNIDQSYHQLTGVELFQTGLIGPINGSSDDYLKHYYNCSGELKATFMINGEIQVVTAQYKVRVQIWEKL